MTRYDRGTLDPAISGLAMVGPTLLAPTPSYVIPIGMEMFFLAVCRMRGSESGGCGITDVGEAPCC